MPHELSGDRLSAALRGIPEATGRTRFDALRVVTHTHLHRHPIEPVPGGTPLSGVRSVLEALGLAESRLTSSSPSRPAANGPRDVACPACGVVSGAQCRNYRGDSLRGKWHLARRMAYTQAGGNS